MISVKVAGKTQRITRDAWGRPGFWTTVGRTAVFIVMKPGGFEVTEVKGERPKQRIEKPLDLDELWT